MKATKNINIYLIDKKPVKVIDVVQYDTGIQLVFTVKDFGIPSEASATLYVQKPSGRFVYQTDGITISGDTVTINLDNQALTEHGKVPYQVTITSGSDTVTSFAGLMLVERSLKDAGATESKTVIKAFDELTADKLAELQTNAKTVIDALIATIPEDYTAMTAKVNESANAIKGSLSGAVVRADDVSPVEHYPVVKVHGKNYCKTNDLTVTGSHPWANKFIDETITLSRGKYTISADYKQTSTQSHVSVSVRDAVDSVTQIAVTSSNEISGTLSISFEITERTKDIRIVFYSNLTAVTIDTACEFANIQLEKSATATEYTPYVDPSTVTVTRCGKNLADISNAVGIGAGDKITIENKSITIAAGSAVYGVVLMDSNACLKKGVTYTLSCNLKGQHDASQWGWRLIDENDKSVILSRSESLVYTPVDNIKTVYFYFSMGEELAENSTISNVQIETSEVVTEYEPYNGTEYTPNADGTINGLTSVSPTMTLLTDTEGVTIECEYNKDTNKVVSKLAEALGITI